MEYSRQSRLETTELSLSLGSELSKDSEGSLSTDVGKRLSIDGQNLVSNSETSILNIIP